MASRQSNRRGLRASLLALGLIALAFGPSPAAADEDDEPAPTTLIDGILGARTRCFASRVSRGALISPDLSRCYLIPGAAGCESGMESTGACFMARRTQEFCTDPRAYCASVTPQGNVRREVSPNGSGVTPMTGTLTPTEADTLFVSPRCESGAPRDVMSQLHHGSGSDNVTGDRALAAMMRSGWGCGEARPTSDARYGRTRLALAHDCDPALMPINCATGEVRIQARDNPLASGVPTRVSAILRDLTTVADSFVSMSFALKGGSFRLSGGRCQVTFADDTISGALGGEPDLPAPAAGQDQAAYLAGIADPATRERARARLQTIGLQDDQAFSISADLLDAGSTRFRLAARSAYNPSRLALLGRHFSAAKEGMLETLRGMSPAPPQAVLDRIVNTNLPDYSAFFAPSPTAAQRTFMSKVEASCRDAGETASGHHNMLNHSHPHPHSGSDIFVCPSALIDMDLGNPRQLVAVLLHELGHSIDTCNLARTQTAVTSPSDPPSRCKAAPTPPIPADQRAGVDAFFGRVSTVADCMRSRRSTPGCAPVVRSGPQQAIGDYGSAVAACYPGQYSSCTTQLYGPSGALRSCTADFSSVNRAKLCASARPGLDAARAGPPATTSGPQDQTQEAFADMLAAEALPRSLARPELTGSPPGAPAYSTYQVNERRAEILTTVSEWCNLGSGSEEHPGPITRVGIFAQTPSIRDALECDPRAVSTAGMPLSGCQRAFFDSTAAAPPAPTCAGSTP